MKENNAKTMKEMAAKKLYEAPSGKVTIISTKDVIYDSAAVLTGINANTLGYGGIDWE